MSTLSASARLALETAIRDVVVSSYQHWQTYPIINGRRCKAEPVIAAATLQAVLSTVKQSVSLASVSAALRRLVASGELELSIAVDANGKQVRAYSPAPRFDVFFADGSRAWCNANGVQIDAAIANFGLVGTYRVSVSDRVSG